MSGFLCGDILVGVTPTDKELALFVVSHVGFIATIFLFWSTFNSAPMFEIKKVSDISSLNSYSIYFNGKLISEKGYQEEDGSIYINECIDFDPQQLKDISARAFPSHFHFHFHVPLTGENYFDCATITRKGNKVTLEINGVLYTGKHDWLLWNPSMLLTEMEYLAKARGYKAKVEDNEYFEIFFVQGTEGMLGEFYNKALEECYAIHQQAEKNLFKLATRRLSS